MLSNFVEIRSMPFVNFYRPVKRVLSLDGGRRLSSGPYFSYYSYFSLLFCCAPSFLYFFLKMPYYPNFFVKNENIYVIKGKIVFSIKLYSCLKEIILSECLY